MVLFRLNNQKERNSGTMDVREHRSHTPQSTNIHKVQSNISLFRKTPDIGLASYSIIPLRHTPFPQLQLQIQNAASEPSEILWKCKFLTNQMK